MLKCILTAVICYFTAAPLMATEYHVAKTGNDTNPGTVEQPFLTISKAANIAQAGDRVIVHAGTYREWVRPAYAGTAAKRIVFEAASGERVDIKGSERVTGWQPIGKTVYRVAVNNRVFTHNNPFAELIAGDWFFPNGKKFHTGEVYLDGQPLNEAMSGMNNMQWKAEVQADSTIISADFGGKDPRQHLTEINVRPACFYPAVTGRNYITVSGFHLSQAASQWAAPTAEQIGLIGTNWSKGWIIEHNIVSDSKCAGITLGKDRRSGQNIWSADMSKDGAVLYAAMTKAISKRDWNQANIGSHLVRNNLIERCGQAGICGSFGAAFSEISNNVVQDIYTNREYFGAEMAGIKLHGAIDVSIRNNHVRNSFIGLWLDWMAQGTLITENVFEQNDYVDFFPEVNHGPYVFANNVLRSPVSLKDWSEGGAYIHNLFGGRISRAPQERVTPFFQPYTTKWAGKTFIKGGDNRFIDNYFIRNGVPYTQPKMHPWDEPDSVQGYGPSIYKDALLPVKLQNNQYVDQALPLPATTNKRIHISSLGKARTTGQAFPGTPLTERWPALKPNKQ